jgi:hypothetical protein
MEADARASRHGSDNDNNLRNNLFTVLPLNRPPLQRECRSAVIRIGFNLINFIAIAGEMRPMGRFIKLETDWRGKRGTWLQILFEAVSEFNETLDFEK